MLVVLAAMALVAARSVHMAITKNLHTPWGGGDFHAYWYDGHFTRLSTGERPVPLPAEPTTSRLTAMSPPPETSPTVTSSARSSVVTASTPPPERASIRSGQSRRCPHCQQGQRVRVHRRWRDRLRRGMTMRLRCHACQREMLV